MKDTIHSWIYELFHSELVCALPSWARLVSDELLRPGQLVAAKSKHCHSSKILLQCEKKRRLKIRRLFLETPKTVEIQNRDTYSFDAKQSPLLEKLERLIDSWARQADEIADFFL